jgi:hypothetical protein
MSGLQSARSSQACAALAGQGHYQDGDDEEDRTGRRPVRTPRCMCVSARARPLPRPQRNPHGGIARCSRQNKKKLRTRPAKRSGGRPDLRGRSGVRWAISRAAALQRKRPSRSRWPRRDSRTRGHAKNDRQHPWKPCPNLSRKTARTRPPVRSASKTPGLIESQSSRAFGGQPTGALIPRSDQARGQIRALAGVYVV